MSDDARADTLLEAGGSLRPRVALQVRDGERYGLGELIGRGGMGEVRAARDVRIEREVAIKRMRSDLRDPQTIARFLREAHVQGALEHPAIVPVHDVGIDGDGTPFFVMKRLAGSSLATVLGTDDARWPRRLLLSRFVDICLAMEFAHTRKIVHRDIKPANLMLGDFGEAYVLDWGLARIGDDAPFSGPRGEDDAATLAGDLLGTPGYMAPEQARGEVATAASDVYALGCVLFEILVGTPANPRGIAGLEATLRASCHRPRDRDAAVAPELDDLCARATDADAARRPTARELGEGVQRYLDGDRDDARRRELAAEHARRAEEALAGSGDDARALAMREAGQAVGLDPSNTTAKRILGKLIVEAPAKMPAGALVSADRERIAARTTVVRHAVYGYSAFTAAASVLLFLPHKRVWPIVAVLVVLTALAGAAHVLARRELPLRTPWFNVMLGVNALALACTGLVFGPLLLMPIVVVGSLAGWLTQPFAYRSVAIFVMHFLPPIALVLLELAGVLPSTFAVRDGSLVLTSPAIELTPLSTFVVLALGTASQAITMTLVVVAGRVAAITAQDRIHAQKWHLEQLVPQDDASDERRPR